MRKLSLFKVKKMENPESIELKDVGVLHLGNVPLNRMPCVSASIKQFAENRRGGNDVLDKAVLQVEGRDLGKWLCCNPIITGAIRSMRFDVSNGNGIREGSEPGVNLNYEHSQTEPIRTVSYRIRIQKA